jgi:hypothetical protein
MRTIYLLSFLFMCCATASAVNITAIPVATLPTGFTESSGIDFCANTEVWTHNDGYGDNNLYRFNTSGTLIKTITITNASNQDWEEITTDSSRQKMFIGDFGNNNNDRTNLKIYKINHPSNINGTSTTAEIINFSYPDQLVIPSPTTNWNFDCEAMIHYGSHLYLFTKCGGTPLSLYTKLYRIPDVAGTYVATLVDSFYTGTRITGATLSPDKSSLVLIGNGNVHLFRNFTPGLFFDGSVITFSISGTWTQKEAVGFKTNQLIYLTDENTGTGNFLYKIDLAQWIPNTTNITNGSEIKVSLYPNPTSQQIQIQLPLSLIGEPVPYQFFDQSGRVVLNGVLQPMESQIDLSHVATGHYYLAIQLKDVVLQKPVVICR